MWPKMFAICNIVRRDQKVTGQSQAEMGTISHSTTDTDKAMASDTRKIQESPVESDKILQITPKATIRSEW